jgi:hypothetical protein
MTLRPKDKQHTLGISRNHRTLTAQTIYDKLETVAHIVPNVFSAEDISVFGHRQSPPA